jgi:hypothetical protein
MEPEESRPKALAALRVAHERLAGVEGADIDHWQDCLESWELVEVKVTAPVGETRHHPFARRAAS